jgi:hypothetical protein
MATQGSAVEARNTHPFLADGIAFAHNGAILPRKQLRMLLSPAYTGQLEGTTDSELFLALIRQRAHELDDTFGGVCSAVATLRREFPDASLNALLLTTEQMVAVHSSEHATVPTDHFTATGLRLADLPPDPFRNAANVGVVVETTVAVHVQAPASAALLIEGRRGPAVYGGVELADQVHQAAQLREFALIELGHATASTPIARPARVGHDEKESFDELRPNTGGRLTPRAPSGRA